MNKKWLVMFLKNICLHINILIYDIIMLYILKMITYLYDVLFLIFKYIYYYFYYLLFSDDEIVNHNGYITYTDDNVKIISELNDMDKTMKIIKKNYSLFNKNQLEYMSDNEEIDKKISGLSKYHIDINGKCVKGIKGYWFDNNEFKLINCITLNEKIIKAGDFVML